MTDNVIFIRERKCLHMSGFIIDDTLDLVECKACKKTLNPMFVLKSLAQTESRLRRQCDELRESVASLSERTRYKCKHCGNFSNLR